MFFCKTNENNCSTLNRILSRYEQSSGQCINFNKSTVTFTAKTPSEIKARVKRMLRIDKEGSVGKYLGLPEHFGRRKRDIFTGLVDKVRQRSHSWTTRTLSGAGKQVLLQSVLSALPTYTMSCFGGIARRINAKFLGLPGRSLLDRKEKETLVLKTLKLLMMHSLQN